MVKNGPFLTVCDNFLTVFDRYFINTMTQCDNHFSLLNTVNQCDKLFFFNTVTQCDKHFFLLRDFVNR